MGTGAITSYVDVAQLVLYAFWAFFAGLVYYLVRENHREGYPDMDSGTGRGVITGWPVPDAKTYKLADGHEHVVPKPEPSQAGIAAEPAHAWTGAPLVPTGDPMLAGVGPGSWAERADRVDTDGDGGVRIRPLRQLPDMDVAHQDRDPRGLPVFGADGEQAGTVVDLWVDTPEQFFRYMEVELTGGARRVLLPINFTTLSRDAVKVKAILGRHFANVPATKDPEQVTVLEEEKICAYFGAGTLYAEPSRQEPLL
ncbi:photosynthetic reaction center subunit H [Rubrivivax gelatinosus]|nr:photosynthetic reaction center subunit H [Rubrivivax gelatinosus]